jgi:hypothetical protein
MFNTKPLNPSVFDRLASSRRNRRLRNYWLAVAAVSLFIGAIMALDPLFSGAPIREGWIISIGLSFVISASVGTYFHLKFQTRE